MRLFTDRPFPPHAFAYKGGLGRVVDPIGLTSVGKKGGGSLKSGWDPLGLVTSTKDPSAKDNSTPTDMSGLVAPPVTMSNLDVVNASQDQLRQEMLKKSIKKTIFAGDTGGFRQTAGNAGIANPPRNAVPAFKEPK